ncbi:amino acid permease, partial [Mycobacterium sp. ITM-2017-0098]
IVIELLMYIVYVLAIKDVAAVEANSAAPIEEIITQQAGPVATRMLASRHARMFVSAMATMTLVATRLTYSMARDNMLPFSHLWRHVSAKTKAPTYAVIGLGCLS